MQQRDIIIVVCSLLLLICHIHGATIGCKCSDGLCCSKDADCGHSNLHCGEGCQAGPCWSKPIKFNETYGGRFTWYNVAGGYTACGSQHGDDELVLALNAPQFDPYTPHGNPNLNTLCNKMIRVTGPYGSADVKLVDRCPGCPYGGLDLSPAAFKAVGQNLDIGVVQGTWYFE